MQWNEAPSCYDAAMEREAMLAGWKINPSFPENRLKTVGWGQPPPVENDKPSVVDLVQKDLYSRKEFGYNKYKTALQTHNGRDALKDAYEEALDLCQYLRQALYEKDGR